MKQNMTLQQLELLVKAYYECELSRSEEEELRKVLLTSPLHSREIDLCRLEMGIEASMRNAGTSRKPTPVRYWLMIAASVALLLGIGSTLVNRVNPSPNPTMTENTIVYISGKKVQDYAYAKKLAEANQAESMAMLNEMLNQAKAEQENCNMTLTKISTTQKNNALN